MSRYKIAFLLLLLSAAFYSNAQDSSSIMLPQTSSAPLDKLSAGVGIGYEYGGIGANAIFYPQRNIGVFGGAGWYYVGVGYNAGIKLRAIINAPSTVIIPYLELMYGSNTFIYYRNNPEYNKRFYNYTIGGGIDIRPNNSKLGFISIAIYVPFRSPDIKNYTEGYIQHFYDVNPTNKLFWLNASIGYKFILWK